MSSNQQALQAPYNGVLGETFQHNANRVPVKKIRGYSDASTEPFPSYQDLNSVPHPSATASEQDRHIQMADLCGESYIGENREDVMQLWVGNLAEGTTEDQIKEFFSPRIPVSQIFLRRGVNSSFLHAFVQYDSTAF